MAISPERMAELLRPFFAEQPRDGECGPSAGLLEQLSVYLELLLRWNRRVNLTAIEEPEEIVKRHFGESLFTGLQLAKRVPEQAEVLDYGSGGGFPGLPIQLLLPKVRVILAESQGRKVAFLREAVRSLGVAATIWPRRVEEMPEEIRFDAVALRAVDRMETAEDEAIRRVREGGWLAVLAGKEMRPYLDAEVFPLPDSEHRKLVLWQKR